MIKEFIAADALGKRQILLKNSTSSAQAAMYIDELCGEKTDCKGVVDTQVAEKIGDRSKPILCTQLALHYFGRSHTFSQVSTIADV